MATEAIEIMRFVAEDAGNKFPNELRGVTVEINGGLTSILGRCIGSTPARIEMAGWLMYGPDTEEVYEQVKETVLHELAHAIAGVRNQHNYIWKHACIKLGCDPSRLAHLNRNLQIARRAGGTKMVL